MVGFDEQMLAEIEHLFGNVRQGRFVSRQNAETAYEQHPVGAGNINPQGFIQDGAISDPVLFAATIRPPIVVSSLPALPDSNFPIGSTVFLTSDLHLYKTTNGTTWGKLVDAGDIVADTITAGQIAAGAIGADEIAANVIQVGHMSDPMGNHVANPGFEIDASGTVGNSITGWAVGTGTAANFVTGSTSVNSGDKDLLITYDGSGTSQILTQSKFIPVEGNKAYNIVGYLRGKGTNSANAAGNVQIAWFDSTKTLIGTVLNNPTQTVGSSTTWVRSPLVRTSPTNAVYAEIRCRVLSTSTNGDVVHFDDLALYRTDRDINHASGNVVIDSTGITITNGKLVLSDQFGNNVITGAGFGASWLDFISEQFYNGHFAVGTTNDITAATLVGSAGNDADYLASLSNDIPYWVVNSESGAGTFKRVSDSTAVGGFALQWDGNESANIFQDIPIVPGRSYQILIDWRYTNSTSGFTRTISWIFLKSDRSNIGSVVDDALAYSTTQAAYQEELITNTDLAPANARYIRYFIQMTRTSGNPTVWLNRVVAQMNPTGVLHITGNPSYATPGLAIADHNGNQGAFLDEGSLLLSSFTDTQWTTSLSGVESTGLFLGFGPGASGVDTYLQRLSADVFTITGAIGGGGLGNLVLDGQISPAQITANTNNYNPTNARNTFVWRIDLDAAHNLTGIAGTKQRNRMHMLQNISSFALTIVHDSANSSVGNRFYCPGNANFSLVAGGVCIVIYDDVLSHWRVMGGN